MAYSIDSGNYDIDYNITFNEGCAIQPIATELFFDTTIPAPVLPRFYSIDRNAANDHYNIEFGWDTIGYMYVFGDFNNLHVPQMLITMPCPYELQQESIVFVNYRSGNV